MIDSSMSLTDSRKSIQHINLSIIILQLDMMISQELAFRLL
jgi:hypothetical protein